MQINTTVILMLGFTAISVLIFGAEMGTFRQAQRLAQNQQVTPRVHFSLRATQKTLMACEKNMSPPRQFFMPAADLRFQALKCGKFAKNVIAEMPTHGLAYLVAAQAENHLNNMMSRDFFLEKSRSNAPFEGWIAERRFLLLAAPKNRGENTVNGIGDRDIATLLTTQSGAELLAGFVIKRPETRPQILAVAASASPKNQDRLSNILIKMAVVK